MPSNTNKIWEHIINKNNINLNENISFITSKQIKESKDSWEGKRNQFEPRLLCKFDNRDSRPEIFKTNSISLISVENKKWALIKEDIYKTINTENVTITDIPMIKNSPLLYNGNSETNMLKILEQTVLPQILGEPIKASGQMGGRHRCRFETIIGEQIVNIDGSQYETDGDYETQNIFAIVEAKKKKCKDFNIRQLYFPLREAIRVYEKAKIKKKFVSLFIYQDTSDIVHVHKFIWMDYKKMLDIHNTGYFKYRILRN